MGAMLVETWCRAMVGCMPHPPEVDRNTPAPVESEDEPDDVEDEPEDEDADFYAW